MKTKHILLSSALVLAATTLSFAQDNNNARPSPGGNGPDGERRPANPLARLFDTDHNGVISADELANASNALKVLDRNGDGQITPDEVRPPGGGQGQGNGQGQGKPNKCPGDGGQGGPGKGRGPTES